MAQNHLPSQDFRPLSFLPMVSAISEGQLADLRPLLANLQAARDKPHVFDDETIDRVIRVHTESLRFLPCTRRQLDQWEGEHPSMIERQTIQRVRAEVDETEQVLLKILALAREIGAGTINKILVMGDFERGLAALAGKRPNVDTGSNTRSPLHADPERLAAQIDARMAELTAAGFDDMAIFTGMVDYLPQIIRLMDQGKLDILCKGHAGLDRYVILIEATVVNLKALLKQSLR